MKKLTKVLGITILSAMLAFLCACGQQNGQATDDAQKQVCTLTIKCETILKNMDKLNPEKKDLIPETGIIFSSDNVSFSQGDSLFDILKQELQKEKIHMAFVENTSSGTTYIEGINNIYAADCGELSGWIYMVNGESVYEGCTEYFPQNGDVIEWVYTCDMGNDI
ncbi:MAG: DUF4430 domain-containing protein [Clostridia bacterium]|nr:DUF4430 domain-containing protein [Clostridia bacterium]